MSPRPILKRDCQPHPHPHHAVHFPPSPALTRTFHAYSSAAYDRSPIVVSPNSCALPERGCPGRTYTLDDAAPALPTASILLSSSHLHPRALALRNALLDTLPQLIPDLSSESEESDGFASPPPDPVHPSRQHPYDSHPPSYPYPSSSSNYPSPISSTPLSASSGPYPTYPDDAAHKPRRRRGERERKHDSAHDPGRIRNGAYDQQPYEYDKPSYNYDAGYEVISAGYERDHEARSVRTLSPRRRTESPLRTPRTESPYRSSRTESPYRSSRTESPRTQSPLRTPTAESPFRVPHRNVPPLGTSPRSSGERKPSSPPKPCAASPPSERKTRKRSSSSASLVGAMSGFSIADDGCLGGF